MIRFRNVLALLLLATMLAGLGARTTDAQATTAVLAPPQTAEGCEQVATYLQERQEIWDAMLVEIGGVFPEVPTPITDHAQELVVAITTMTPQQFVQLANVYALAADKIESVDVPALASFYNFLQVQLYRVSANLFADSATTGLSAAGARNAVLLTMISNQINVTGEGVTAVCPAFADVVTLDQTQILG